MTPHVRFGVAHAYLPALLHILTGTVSRVLCLRMFEANKIKILIQRRNSQPANALTRDNGLGIVGE